MLCALPTEVGDNLHQFLSTTITTATEVISNDVIVKQVFEPQMSTETGAGAYLYARNNHSVNLFFTPHISILH